MAITAAGQNEHFLFNIIILTVEEDSCAIDLKQITKLDRTI